MRSLWRDVVYGVRVLSRAPGFGVVVVLMLALGIGANTAIFSIVDAVLLQPLPFPDADRLVAVWEEQLDESNSIMYASPPNYMDWRERGESFEEMGAHVERDFILTQDNGVRRVQGAEVTASLFRTLGVAPALGRGFSPEDDRAGAEPVAIIGHDLWQREYGGDPDIVNRTIRLDAGTVLVEAGAYRVIGVMPPDFDFPPLMDLNGRSEARETEIWIPLGSDSYGYALGRGAHSLVVIARLRPDVSLERAQSEMDGLAASLRSLYPDTNADYGVGLVPLDEAMAGEARTALWVLLGAVGVLLLIACVNVANLLVARAVDREHEFAIRTALGAGRGSLARQALVESQLLALAGGVLGLLLAFMTLGALVRFAPADVPRLADASIDLPVLGYALALSVVTGLVFGLAPVLRTRTGDLVTALKSGGRGGADTGGSTLRNGLVVVEVALSFVLLIGGGLLFRSFLTLRGVDTGIETEQLVTMRLDLPEATYPDDERIVATFRDLEERVRSLPEVASAGFTADLPLAMGFDGTQIQFENVPTPPDERWIANFTIVTPGYFGAMGIPIASGRPFGAGDGADGTLVAIVNQAVQRRYLRDRDALGQRIEYGPPRRVVGTVGDVRLETLRDDPMPTFYLPHAQARRPRAARSMSLVVRHRTADAGAVVNAVRDAIHSVDRSLPIHDVRTMDQILGERLGGPRFSAYMVLAFSVLALALAGVGIYGVISYLVGRRTREIGIRIALGASPVQAGTFVVREGMRLVAIGVGLGLVVALGASRSLESQLYEVAPTDPSVFAGVSAFLVLVGLAASALPASRAAGVEPTETLRHD